MFVKVLRTVINVLSVLMIVLALVVLLSVVMTKPGNAPSVMGYSSFRVLSGSMEPTLHKDALIIVRKTAPADIQVGDIISFYSSDPALAGAVNTHRVYDVAHDNGIYRFQTKGDANMVPDEYPVSGNEIIGVVIFTSPFLGVLVRLLSNPIVFIPVILVPLLALLILNMVKTVKLAKLAAKEAEEKEIAEIKAELERRKEARAAEEAAKDTATAEKTEAPEE